MRKFKMILGGLFAFLLLFIAAIYGVAYWHLNQVYNIQSTDIDVPTDASSLAEGKRLYAARQCPDCHMFGFEGKIQYETFLLGRLVIPNLTGGAGGQKPSSQEIIRAVRHGVGQNGKPLALMPANEYAYLSDEELGKIIAYVNSLPPVDNELPANKLGPGPMALIAVGFPNALPARWIDHDAPRPKVVKAEATVEFGRYLSKGCHHCHGENLAGQRMIGEPPDKPSAPNITFDKQSGIGNWTKEDFYNAMRNGIRPDGSVLDIVMPWLYFNQMTDVELDALWVYLQSFPPN